VRKVFPPAICKDFVREIQNLIDFHNDVAVALPKQSNYGNRFSTLAEVVFHRGYVAFEEFISDSCMAAR